MGTRELDRLAERDAAGRRYNEALTALDEALPRAVTVPAATPAPVPAAEALHERAAILGDGVPMPRGWRGRLAGFVWRLVGPLFQRQQEYNLALADHLAHAGHARRESARAAEDAYAAMRQHLEALVAFDSRLVQYLQQITPFVDTKIRVVEGAIGELRMASTAALRSAVAAKRELDRLALGREPPRAEEHAAAAPSQEGRRPAPLAAGYVGFEDLFRGSSADIRERQREYADRLTVASDVLDLGCGRGELLDLLRERGVSARGVEANAEMAEVCRTRGLDVEVGDALSVVAAQPDESLGGLVALQVVEHLEPDYLVRLIEAAHAKLRPGSLIVLETINAACWVAFFESYIRDITHVRPLHPDTLKFLVVAAGFENVEVQFRSPIAAQGRLEAVRVAGTSGDLAELARAFNANVERLNARLFTHLEYAVIGRKGL
jgi:SAM-dependent methyltransferase